MYEIGVSKSVLCVRVYSVQVYNLIFGTYPKVGSKAGERDEGQHELHSPGEKLVQLEVQDDGNTLTHISLCMSLSFFTFFTLLEKK